MRYSALTLLPIFVAGQMDATIPMRPIIPAVTEINEAAYLGTWYEVYANDVVLSAYPYGKFCSTSSYGVNEDGTFSVHNYQRNVSPQGPATDVYGVAYPPDMSKPGELLFQSQAPPATTTYWIVNLGPIINGQYEWALVSDMYSASFSVLARDITRFEMVYKDALLATAMGLGYSPIPVYQGSDCVYSSADSTPAVPSPLPPAVPATPEPTTSTEDSTPPTTTDSSTTTDESTRFLLRH